MNIEILHLIEGAQKARGLAVIIDVFRAFTVECYAIAGGVRNIYPVGALEQAYALKRRFPNALLVGERGGAMCEGFDCGNSPSALTRLELTGKTMIHTTSAGTQGIINAKNADTILTGSLVNAAAIARYIRKSGAEHVSLVCMGLAGKTSTEEDTLCAEYIRALVLGQHPDITAKMNALMYTSGAKFFDPAQQSSFPQADFAMCLKPDQFDFVLRVNTRQSEYTIDPIYIDKEDGL